ncbi:unnamed protein product [Caenorhabditis brenneri]
MEFGGGLGRFAASPSIKNECQEIVEVPGGAEWKIRKLQVEFEDYCWKYPGSSVIVNYHLKRLQSQVTPEDENQRMFYAKVSHFMSPLEISLQPKYLSSARKSIMNQMNATYNWREKKPDGFLEEQIFVPVACAVQELGIWYRGRIQQISGEQHVVVELIDFGTQILAPREHILPLLRRFGRAPPLCLKCKSDGLTVNDLEIKDLHEFKDIVSDCNALFRVEIKSIEEPFLVDLYHPTISGFKVCEKFFPPPEDSGKLERIARSWDAHCKKMNEETDEDEDFEEEYGDRISREPPRIKYMSRLPKCQRAPRFEQDVLLVEYIENSQLVYLQYPWQVKKRRDLDKLLYNSWNRLPRIPEGQKLKDHVCVIRNPRLDRVCRGVIIDERMVLLVDYGRFVKCPTTSDLRLLPAEGVFMEEPMLTIISMTRCVSTQWPHHSETQFLRQRLPRGAQVRFRWDKKSKTTPMRGRLTSVFQRETVNDQMANHMQRLKIDGSCRQLDVYRPRPFHVLPRGNHVYRATCHPHYSKGTEEFMWI